MRITNLLGRVYDAVVRGFGGRFGNLKAIFDILYSKFMNFLTENFLPHEEKIWPFFLF